MKRILTIGGNGMVGNRITELLKSSYEFVNFDRSNGVDITRSETLTPVEADPGLLIILFAAKANVDACEKDKSLGENGEAWKVNVLGTENVVNLCQKTGKKLIYISTDFVFDGEHMPENGYSESDTPNPINWYGVTKRQAEKRVEKLDISLIVRIAYPYRAKFERNDFMRAMLSRLQTGQQIQAVTDHLFTPTFIDDIAFALKKLIDKNADGVFHVTGSQTLTPYDAAMIVAKTFDIDSSLIHKNSRQNYFKNRAPRPFQLGMNNAKIEKLGIEMNTFEKGLLEIKRQKLKVKSTSKK